MVCVGVCFFLLNSPFALSDEVLAAVSASNISRKNAVIMGYNYGRLYCENCIHGMSGS